jgi:hypothetical protein
MTKQRLRGFAILVACCFVTAHATRWFVLADMRLDCEGAVEFYKHGDTLKEFVSTLKLEDGENILGEKLPPSLQRIGITNVYRNGRYVYFVLPHSSFLADDATREIIWQCEHNGGAIEEILRTTKRNTYHIQEFSSARGWYYWEHN